MPIKKCITAFAAAIIALGLQAAEPKAYSLDVRDFSELQISDGINVVYKCSSDSAGIVTFTATPDLVTVLQFTNNKNKLKIQLSGDGIVRKNLPVVTVRSRFLSYAQNAGDSTLIVESPAPGAGIKLRIIGNGTIVANGVQASVVEGITDAGKGMLTISGKTPMLKLRQLGAGVINTNDLEADRVDIKMAGTGSVRVNAVDYLSITGLSSGKVYLSGNPDVKNRTMGSVKVIRVATPVQP